MSATRPFSPSQQALLSTTMDFVRPLFQADATGHDFHHLLRVVAMADRIAVRIGADRFVVTMAAWLHDVDDPKMPFRQNGSGVRDFLSSLDQSLIDTAKILDIIENLSYSSTLAGKRETTLEGFAVQDADRLDALGAIGIARAFAYGGSRQRPIYLGLIDDHSSLAHFYQKLLRLPALMNTRYARRIAKSRERVLRRFLQSFLRDWNMENQ